MAHINIENILSKAEKIGKEPYKYFASVWLSVPYNEVTEEQRNEAKKACWRSILGDLVK